MATPINERATPGFRFLKDLYPAHRGAGLAYYPYSSVFSGLVPSWTPAAGTNTVNQTVAISAGSAYLDGQMSTLATGVNVVVTPGTVTEGENLYFVLLNPTRKLVPTVIGAEPPTTLLNGVAVANGDMYAECYDTGEYLVAESFYKRVADAWTTFDPSFEAPPVPVQQGKSRVWGNNVSPVITLSNFVVNAIEKKMYVGTNYPPYTNSNSKALLRDSATLHIATLSLWYEADTLVPAKSSILAINNLTNP